MKTTQKTAMLLGLLIIGIGMVAAGSSSITTLINVLLCRIITVLWGVSAAVATIVIVIAGIKWIGSSEDAGARAQAKSTIVHAVIGLIIVMVALVLVNWVIGGTGPLSTFTFVCAG